MYLPLPFSVSTILTIYIKYNSALLKADSHRSKLTGLASFLQWWSPILYMGYLWDSMGLTVFCCSRPLGAFGPSCHFPLMRQVTCRQRRRRLHHPCRTLTTCPCWIQDWVCKSWPGRRKFICAQIKGETLDSWKALQVEGSNNS